MRLPLILGGLGVEKAGRSNDFILWQVPVLGVVQERIQDFSKGVSEFNYECFIRVV